MSTLDRLLRREVRPVDAVFQRELRRARRWEWQEPQWRGYILLLVSVALVLLLGPLSVTALAIVSLPVFGWAWRVQLALSASPMIAGEVEAGTWDLLRALPWSTAELVRAKHTAVLVRHRRFLGQYMLLRFFVALGMLLIAATTLWFDAALDASARYNPWLVIVALALSIAYLLGEPLLDLATDGALGMAASAFARTRGEAARLALVASVAGLAAQLALAAALIGAAAGLAPGSGSPLQLWTSDLMALWGLAVWGPGGALLYNVSPGACVLLIPLAGVLRYGALRGLLALAAWRAARR
ncbi:MAG: hypothetical protein Kow00120_19890 [Anaerolineae bacterium]